MNIIERRHMILANCSSRMSKRLDLKSCLFHKYIKSVRNNIDVATFLTLAQKKVYRYISKTIKKEGCIKSNLTLCVIMKKYTIDDQFIYEKAYFQSSFHEFLTRNQIKKLIPLMYDKISCAFDCFTKEGSGWILHKICHLEIKNVKCSKKLTGS